MKEFCKRLTQLRKDYGFTQKMMAEKLQIRQPSYIRYEKGTAEPTLTSLKILAETFDVSVDYLLGMADI